MLMNTQVLPDRDITFKIPNLPLQKLVAKNDSEENEKNYIETSFIKEAQSEQTYLVD